MSTMRHAAIKGLVIGALVFLSGLARPALAVDSEWTDPESEKLFRYIGDMSIYDARRACSEQGTYWSMVGSGLVDLYGRILVHRMFEQAPFRDDLMTSRGKFLVFSDFVALYQTQQMKYPDWVTGYLNNQYPYPSVCVYSPY